MGGERGRVDEKAPCALPRMTRMKSKRMAVSMAQNTRMTTGMKSRTKLRDPSINLNGKTMRGTEEGVAKAASRGAAGVSMAIDIATTQMECVHGPACETGSACGLPGWGSAVVIYGMRRISLVMT